MKQVVFLICVLFSLQLYAQDSKSTWSGTLTIPQGKLRLVLNVTSSGSGLKATMDSPDQNAYGINVDSVSITSDNLFFMVKRLNLNYSGTIDHEKNICKGNLTQQGFKMPLDLTKGAPELPKINRPQEPKPPYPYTQKEVTITNTEGNVTLAGTLTIPEGKGPFAAVVMITGSGPQNRDEEIFGHKPFMVIADYLTKHGIAVLRYDDRGIGKSTGSFSGSTTFDFAADAQAAVNFLKAESGIDAGRIGVIGHSEGGLIAYILAAKKGNLSFAVSLAGPALRGDELLMQQSEKIMRLANMPEATIAESLKANRTIYDILLSEKDSAVAKGKISAIAEELLVKRGAVSKEQIQKEVAAQVAQCTSPWFKAFVSYDPTADIAAAKIPLLFMVGEKDIQVPALSNITALNEIVKKWKKKNITMKMIPGVNHLFQSCKQCSVREYGDLEETFSPDALSFMEEWIKSKTEKK